MVMLGIVICVAVIAAYGLLLWRGERQIEARNDRIKGASPRQDVWLATRDSRGVDTGVQ